MGLWTRNVVEWDMYANRSRLLTNLINLTNNEILFRHYSSALFNPLWIESLLLRLLQEKRTRTYVSVGGGWILVGEHSWQFIGAEL